MGEMNCQAHLGFNT